MFENILSKPEIIWFIIGLVMFILELIIPGFFIFFFALGAWVTALVCLIADPGINVQLVIFTVSSVLSLLLLRRIIQKKFFQEKITQSDEIEDEFTGKEAIVVSDIKPGENGTVEFKGTTWKAESESEIKTGQTVIITGKKNFKLFVKLKI
jgi:inner membrane protein